MTYATRHVRRNLLSRFIFGFVMFGCCLAAMPALADEPAADPTGLTRPSVWYHHSSTAFEGAQHGRAHLLSAFGEYLVNWAYANYVAQQAQGLAIANRQAMLNAWLERRKAYAERTYGDRVDLATIRKCNAARLPRRLEADELAAPKVVIHWPMLLRGEAFAAERLAMERVIRSRSAYNSGPSSCARAQAVLIRDQMLSKLKRGLQAHSQAVDPMQYTASRKFVESLAYETLFAPTAEAKALELATKGRP